MAVRLFKKSDLIAGVIVFGVMAVFFVAAAAFADKIGGRLWDDSGAISTGDPAQSSRLKIWRAVMFAGALCCVLLSWICYRGSRRIGD